MTKKAKEELSDREVYLTNRNNMLEDFRSSLREVQKEKPSVGGTIAGMDFQQFSAAAVFMAIVEQENYIEYTEKYKPRYVILKEEKKILKDMIKEAKAVFGKNYKAWYEREKEK